jgi:phosphoglycolate phosphatase
MNTQPSPIFDSIIFDLDGTLWDASPACTKAWNRALEESGNTSFRLEEDTIRSFSGLRIEKVFEQFFQVVPENEQTSLLDLYKKYETFFMRSMGGELFPGVQEILPELGSYHRLFIVSNCLKGYIENFIGWNKLEGLFTDFECSGNTGLPKAKNIELIIARNRLQRPVYVGDTVWDYEASKANHIPFIYASYGFGKISEPVDKVDSFAQLRQFINGGLTGI